MLKLETKQNWLIREDSLWDGLQALEIGLFLLSREGYLLRCNETAHHIFGLRDSSGWGDIHVSKIDTFLATGLASKINHIIENEGAFSETGLTCTNAEGRYFVLDISCRTMRSGDDDEPFIIGFLCDTNGRQPAVTHGQNRAEDIQILSAIASALSSSCALSEILKVILTGATASQGLGFNRAFLFLHDKTNHRLLGNLAVGPSSAEEAGHIWNRLEAENKSLPELLDDEKSGAIGDTDPINRLIEGLQFDLDTDSLISAVCTRGAWVNLQTVDKVDEATTTFLEKLGTTDMALVPMVSKGNLMGLLAADCTITRTPISDESVHLLQVLANQAAVAMERAELYEEQIERASQLQQLNVLLGESQEHIIKIEKMSVIGELTAAIAHELRNPLTVIGGFANMMLKADISDEQREYLQIIANETRRSESVLDHVLDFSKASKCDHCEIDLTQLIEKNLQTLKGRLRRANLDISLSMDRQEMKIFGNYDQLSHAFYQFFRVVAEDLIPPGTAEIRTERQNNQATMWIRINVDQSDRDRAIKAMRQIFSENKTSHRLTILVAGETIKYHGGDFGVALKQNSAPSLYVQLPLAKERNDAQ